MVAVSNIPLGEVVGTADQRVIMHQVPWAHFEAMLALRGDTAGPRVTYIEGELELMSPSQNHESIKTLIARMLEYYALEQGLRLSGFGSWTLRIAPKERAVEPDECYIVGDARQKKAPDLAIEVIWTSGGLNKLEAYRYLGVGEVWLWRNEIIEVHRLEGEHYVRSEGSVLFPSLDLALMARLSVYEDQSAAMNEFRSWLRSM